MREVKPQVNARVAIAERGAIRGDSWDNNQEAKRPLGGARTPLIQGADDHYPLRLRDRMTILSTRYPERHLGDSCDCPPEDHAALIWPRVDRTDACWLWRLKPNKLGYGNLWHAGRAWLAHRFVYETLVGRIPDGLALDHLCRVRMCVNPAHLEPVTYEENWRRGKGAGARWLDAPSPIPQIERRPYRPRDSVSPDDPRHGTTSGYAGLGCRCDRCKAAHREAARAYRARKNAGVTR